uniref:Uncharacterized protein n=1 Tax=Rhizophora mucronata TaxID=61149 RepID=A0A2P2QX16_RHIMU
MTNEILICFPYNFINIKLPDFNMNVDFPHC